MKEIIEYILAGLIIISTIPIYDYIVNNLYSPPDLTVDYSLLNLFTQYFTSIVEKPFLHGNSSSPIFSFEKYLEAKLGYILSGYRYSVEVSSASLARVFFNTTTSNIVVETLEPGKINILVLYRDVGKLIFKNTSISSFSYKTINNTYIYVINTASLGITNPNNMIYITAVLETPSYRYINYYLFENRARKIYFVENNNKIAIAAPSSLINTTILNASIVFYNQGEYFCLNRSIYEEPRKITGNIIEFYEVELNYIFENTGNISIDSVSYRIFDLLLLVRENITRIRIRPDYEEVETTISTRKINVFTPIYNLVLALLYDNRGNVYLAEWYPHKLVFGYNIPRDLPVSRISVVSRIGMVDYLVTIYMWRSRV